MRFLLNKNKKKKRKKNEEREDEEAMIFLPSYSSFERQPL